VDDSIRENITIAEDMTEAEYMKRWSLSEGNNSGHQVYQLLFIITF
jgi:hypothetical protein